MRVFARHFVRPDGTPMCAALRQVFERRGLNYDEMLNKGITVEDLRRIKHPSVERVIRNAERG